MNFSANRESLGNSKTATDNLCQLLQQQAAPEVDTEVFDGDLLNFMYFVSIFWEVVETKLEDPRGQLTQLIKYTNVEAKDLVKNCINLPSEKEYRESMRILHNRYGDPQKTLAPYRKKIKEWPALKAGNAPGFRRFLNLLVKSKSLLAENNLVLLSLSLHFTREGFKSSLCKCLTICIICDCHIISIDINNWVWLC